MRGNYIRTCKAQPDIPRADVGIGPYKVPARCRLIARLPASPFKERPRAASLGLQPIHLQVAPPMAVPERSPHARGVRPQ